MLFKYLSFIKSMFSSEKNIKLFILILSLFSYSCTDIVSSSSVVQKKSILPYAKEFEVMIISMLKMIGFI